MAGLHREHCSCSALPICLVWCSKSVSEARPTNPWSSSPGSTRFGGCRALVTCLTDLAPFSAAAPSELSRHQRFPTDWAGEGLGTLLDLGLALEAALLFGTAPSPHREPTTPLAPTGIGWDAGSTWTKIPKKKGLLSKATTLILDVASNCLQNEWTGLPTLETFRHAIKDLTNNMKMWVSPSMSPWLSACLRIVELVCSAAAAATLQVDCGKCKDSQE